MICHLHVYFGFYEIFIYLGVISYVLDCLECEAEEFQDLEYYSTDQGKLHLWMFHLYFSMLMLIIYLSSMHV